uniref:probable G-protein coupled receptor 139 n=1 Tax=Pristiophorus japonicus TaxID=55135 RepID=UPI00398F6478
MDQLMLLIKEIFYPILASVGVPANLVTMVILSRGNCGLSKCISLYMMAMATADLLVMIINVTMYHIFSYYFPLTFIYHTPVCKFIIYMAAVTLDLSVWFTVSFTFDRFVVICCQKFKSKYCTETTAAVVITTFTVLIFLKNFPVLFVNKPQQTINTVQWGCRTSMAFISSPAGAAYIWFHSAWGVWLPFTLIALLNCLTIRRILVASISRKGLRGHRSENQSDPEMESRRKSVILLFAVSGSFILLWLTTAVSLVTTKLTNLNYYRGDLTDPGYIATETGAMLKCLSCFQNPCIYAATQKKFKEELKNLVVFNMEEFGRSVSSGGPRVREVLRSNGEAYKGPSISEEQRQPWRSGEDYKKPSDSKELAAAAGVKNEGGLQVIMSSGFPFPRFT